MTNRERVEATTGDGTCGQGCHSTLINPAGFAFENYDVIGKWRTEEKGKVVDSSGTYPFLDGPQSFTNAVEFSRFVAAGVQAHQCYTQNWATYLHARALTAEEKPWIDYLAQRSQRGEISAEQLVLSIVIDETFVQRTP